jgi:hypothetical protein
MKCDVDGSEMIIVFTRKDGYHYFTCPLCHRCVGEEPKKYFEEENNI